MLAPAVPRGEVAVQLDQHHDPAVIEVADVSVRFGELHAVEDLSFVIRRGEFVSLLGPSGCGKSTMLKAIAGVVRPSSGSIVLRPGQMRVGFMFQKPLLLPWRTTLQNVLLPVELRFRGSAVRPADRQRAIKLLDTVGLGDFVEALPHQLSGGMQQRAALARTLMTDPDVLLLDEPFGALDELTREGLNEELLDIWRSGTTRLRAIVMVTHSIPEAVSMSDRVLILAPRPARLLEAVVCDCAYPRVLGDSAVASLIQRVRARIREAA